MLQGDVADEQSAGAGPLAAGQLLQGRVQVGVQGMSDQEKQELDGKIMGAFIRAVKPA